MTWDINACENYDNCRSYAYCQDKHGQPASYAGKTCECVDYDVYKRLDLLSCTHKLCEDSLNTIGGEYELYSSGIDSVQNSHGAVWKLVCYEGYHNYGPSVAECKHTLWNDQTNFVPEQCERT